MSTLDIQQLVENFLLTNGHDTNKISNDLLNSIETMIEVSFQKAILDTRMILINLSDDNGNINANEAKECVRSLLFDYGILQDSDPLFEDLKQRALNIAEDSLNKSCLYREIPEEAGHDWNIGDPETLESICNLVLSTEETSAENLYYDNLLHHLQENYPDYS
tara:strand:+ start:2201 stop:2689 length:489 start_codon:yes stop_codon:yes gene_type:complete